ncbi:MAG TPA: methyltransferase [Stellaceae bacterium]|nr:methyltransferase [Stellaceae bacterium]
MSTQPTRPEIKPATIYRHAFGIYPSMAMLAGMQLDVFTPLKDGPMTAAEVARAIGVDAYKLQPLLYALVNADLLTVEGERFANTPEAQTYLVRGAPAYVGSAHELYADLWHAALQTGRSIRTGMPQVKHDFSVMSDDELGAFFRGLHAGALTVGRQLSARFGFDRVSTLLDVGGGSGGLAIAACQSCADLSATVVELPRIVPFAEEFVRNAGFAARIKVQATNVVERAPEGRFDVATLRNLVQVLGPDDARRAIANIGRAVAPGGLLLIIGHVVDDSGTAPSEAVGMNLAFLSIYDEGQARSEREHRAWLAEAGFADIEVHYRAAQGGASIVAARKRS